MEGSQVINNPFRALVKDANGDIIYWGGLQQIGGENLNQGGTRYPIELNRITDSNGKELYRKTIFGNREGNGIWSTEIKYVNKSLLGLSIKCGFELGSINSNTEMEISYDTNVDGEIYYQMDISTRVVNNEDLILHTMSFKLMPGIDKVTLTSEMLDNRRIVREEDGFYIINDIEKTSVRYENDKLIDLQFYKLLMDENGICLVPNGNLVPNVYGIFYVLSAPELMNYLISILLKYENLDDDSLLDFQKHFTSIDFNKLMKGKFVPLGITI